MLSMVLLTSLLPRPKPLMTGPRSLSGKGGCGVSGPAMGSRGPSGRTIVLVWSCSAIKSGYKATRKSREVLFCRDGW